MKKIIKYIASILGIIALLGGLVGLNTAVQTNNQKAESSQITGTEDVRLDVALVNEDRPVQSGGTQLNLGSSYIKNIERDSSQNWYVVGRGTAEKGIQDGSYQLAVIIPGDFSSKILDIDSLAAEQAIITYQVNAGGNQQLEMEAERVGREIVSDLNSRLINMYIAGVLTNLQTAQRNVRILTAQEIENIQTYEEEVLGKTTDFPDVFTSISSTAEGSVSAGENLLNSLTSTNEFLTTLESSEQTADQSLSELIEQRSQDAISYEEFVSALLQMNSETLALDLSGVLSSLETTQASIEDTELTIISGESDAATLGNTIAALREKTEELEQTIEESEEELNQLVSDTIQNLYPNHDDNADLTIGELLMLTWEREIGENDDGEIITESVPYLDTTSKDVRERLEEYEQDLTAFIEEALSSLPTTDASELYELAGDMEELDEDAGTEVKNFDPSRVEGYSYSTDADAWNELINRKNTLRQASTATLELSDSTLTQVEGTLRVEAADSSTGLVIEEWTYDSVTASGGDTADITIKDGELLSVSFSYSDPTAVPQTDQIEVYFDNTLVSLNFDEDAYTDAVAAYAMQVQYISDCYRTVTALFNGLPTETLSEISDNFFEQSAEDLIRAMLISALRNQNEQYTLELRDQLTSLREEITTLEEQEDVLLSQMENLSAQTQETIEVLSEQLTAIGELQTQAEAVNTQEQTVTSQMQSSDSGLSSFGSDLSMLLSASSELRISSDSNVSEAGSVTLLFEDFEGRVQSATEAGDELSENVNSLMEQFTQEAADSSQFSESFGSVLENLYTDGTINESMVEFLSQPVDESVTSIEATVNVYRPFTWVLMMEIVSLFTAYLFSAYNLTRKMKDRFRINPFLDTDWINTGMIFILALLSGIVISVVSASSLAVESELIPTWVLSVILFQLLLTELQYCLLKNLKAVGMGLSFFMTISFVYLSNAVGTTPVIEGVPARLKNINLLSLLESVLSRYFDGQQISLAMVFLIFLSIVALLFANTFITIRFDQLLKSQRVRGGSQ